MVWLGLEDSMAWREVGGSKSNLRGTTGRLRMWGVKDAEE